MTLTFIEVWHQFVDNILHGPIRAEVHQRLCLMDLDIALGTELATLEILDNATLAN